MSTPPSAPDRPRHALAPVRPDRERRAGDDEVRRGERGGTPRVPPSNVACFGLGATCAAGGHHSARGDRHHRLKITNTSWYTTTPAAPAAVDRDGVRTVTHSRRVRPERVERGGRPTVFRPWLAIPPEAYCGPWILYAVEVSLAAALPRSARTIVTRTPDSVMAAPT